MQAGTFTGTGFLPEMGGARKAQGSDSRKSGKPEEQMVGPVSGVRIRAICG